MTPDLCAFVVFAGVGAAVKLVWDVFVAFRESASLGVAAGTALDILWWFATVWMMIYGAAISDFTRPRLFLAVGAVLGGLLYHITISSPVRALFYVIFATILKIIKFIFKMLLTPGAFLYKMLLGSLKACKESGDTVSK